MNGFSEKSRAGLITEAEEGENIYPPNKLLQMFLTQEHCYRYL